MRWHVVSYMFGKGENVVQRKRELDGGGKTLDFQPFSGVTLRKSSPLFKSQSPCYLFQNVNLFWVLTTLNSLGMVNRKWICRTSSVFRIILCIFSCFLCLWFVCLLVYFWALGTCFSAQGIYSGLCAKGGDLRNHFVCWGLNPGQSCAK